MLTAAGLCRLVARNRLISTLSRNRRAEWPKMLASTCPTLTLEQMQSVQQITQACSGVLGDA
jgi:hypothetical protein